MNTAHNNYALIAYKSDGFQTCMGCTTETFGSSFVLHTTIDMDTCAKKHAELRRVEYSDQEPEWDITILYRGVPIREVGGPVCDLYMAQVDQEVEDQNEAARVAQVEAARVAEEARIAREEAQNQIELNAFFATAKRLNYEVTPHQTTE